MSRCRALSSAMSRAFGGRPSIRAKSASHVAIRFFTRRYSLASARRSSAARHASPAPSSSWRLCRRVSRYRRGRSLESTGAARSRSERGRSSSSSKPRSRVIAAAPASPWGAGSARPDSTAGRRVCWLSAAPARSPTSPVWTGCPGEPAAPSPRAVHAATRNSYLPRATRGPCGLARLRATREFVRAARVRGCSEGTTCPAAARSRPRAPPRSRCRAAVPQSRWCPQSARAPTIRRRRTGSRVVMG